jgi:hypothetical protein
VIARRGRATEESIKDSKGKIIKKGTLFYYTCLNHTIYALIKNILKIAENNGIDVFSAYNIMEHGCILKELNFDEFGADTYYYLYNWKVRALDNKQIGLTIMQ